MDLQQALNLFGLPYIVSDVLETGVSTDYRIVPTNKQATISRLKSRLDDIQAATGETISLILENGLWLRVEKKQKTIYRYKDYNGYVYDRYNSMELPYMVGLTTNECIVEDLTQAPHLLVAGTTGSGKSNYLHTVIDSILCNNNVHLSLIDCKRVEFSIYKNCANVYLDVKGAYFITAWFIQELNERKERLEQAGCRDFQEYRRKYPDAKYEVLIIDELADLLMNKEDRKRIAPRLQQLAQVGRAAGIHMILATQRPDCETIDGVLKANIPTRIAFNVSSRIDSQIIIDRTGAERLTGNGDGLYLDKKNNLTRFQACFYPTKDLEDDLKRANLL